MVWNLEVTKETVEELEVSYSAPAAMPAVEQNLIPQKDDTFVKFGNFNNLKKVIDSRLFYPIFITDCPVTVRLSRWSKRVLKRNENSSV